MGGITVQSDRPDLDIIKIAPKLLRQRNQLPIPEESEKEYKQRQAWMSKATEEQLKEYRHVYWETERKREAARHVGTPQRHLLTVWQ